MKLYFLIAIFLLAIQKASSCYDNSRYARSCSTYRAKGYCTSNRKFMAVNCKKTCGLCPVRVVPNLRVKLPSNCRNLNTAFNCNFWTNKGYCYTNSRYRNFMKKNCYMTCGYCKKITVTLKPVVIKKTCEDNRKHASQCKGWKQYCKAPTRYFSNKWFSFMKENCAKTCAFCRPVWIKNRTTQTPTTKHSTTPKTTTSTTASVRPAVMSECGIDKKNKDGAFLVGGTDAQRHRWVWQVAIYYFDQFICGGSIISPQYILTAAHCVRWRIEDGLKVIAGDHVREVQDGGEQEIEVIKLKYHEKYDGQTIDNDIAILKLKTPLTLTNNIGLVCLPQLNGYTLQAKDNCFVTGWGRVRIDDDPIDILQEAKMNIVTNEVCGKKNVDKLGKSKVTKNMICAGTELDDISGCQGDSGGPLVCKTTDNKWVQHGVVSWGSSACNATLRYTVFAKVKNYIGWIDKNMK